MFLRLFGFSSWSPYLPDLQPSDHLKEQKYDNTAGLKYDSKDFVYITWSYFENMQNAGAIVASSINNMMLKSVHFIKCTTNERQEGGAVYANLLGTLVFKEVCGTECKIEGGSGTGEFLFSSSKTSYFDDTSVIKSINSVGTHQQSVTLGNDKIFVRRSNISQCELQNTPALALKSTTQKSEVLYSAFSSNTEKTAKGVIFCDSLVKFEMCNFISNKGVTSLILTRNNLEFHNSCFLFNVFPYIIKFDNAPSVKVVVSSCTTDKTYGEGISDSKATESFICDINMPSCSWVMLAPVKMPTPLPQFFTCYPKLNKKRNDPNPYLLGFD